MSFFIYPPSSPQFLMTFHFYCCSVPAGLQFEKFNMPDAVRILDGIMETLSY